MHGTLEVLCKDGRQGEDVPADEPGFDLLYVPAMVWASEKYETQDTVLLVRADQRYANADSIRDSDEFLKLPHVTGCPPDGSRSGAAKGPTSSVAASVKQRGNAPDERRGDDDAFAHRRTEQRRQGRFPDAPSPRRCARHEIPRRASSARRAAGTRQSSAGQPPTRPRRIKEARGPPPSPGD